MEKRKGHYLGTEVDDKWWRRYSQGGFLARGLGVYWFDNEAFFFHRHLTNNPIVIAFRDMLDVKVGKWHSGRWAGGALVVKIVWRTNGQRLNSGFILSTDAHETGLLLKQIQSLVRHPDREGT